MINGVSDISSKMMNTSLEGYKEIALEKTSSSTINKQAGNMSETRIDNNKIDQFQKTKEEKLTEKNVDEMTGELNDLMEKMNYDLKFSYYKDLDRLVMKVVDRKTQETIKQMPPEEMLETLTNLKEWIGVFLDKNA
ncbi:flagellar protein FlaG [Anaerosinus sp.]